MRIVMMSLLIGVLLPTVALAQETITNSVSNSEFLSWVSQREGLWDKELFRLEVCGDPASQSLQETRHAILAVRDRLKSARGGEATAERRHLQSLVMTLEQGLEAAFSSSPSECQYYSSTL